jgi:uncharacterized protein YggE
MKREFGLFVAVFALGALVLTGCTSKTTVVADDTARTGINVSGQGIAYGAPDVADVEIGVQAQARTVAEARSQAAASMDAVVNSIKANGVAADDIRTVQFSVDPRYTTPPGGGTSTLTGYQVSNVVTVRIRKLDTTGKIVDDAAAAGGNNTVVRRIAFSILDQTKLQAEARALAVKDAKDRGDKLAQLNGIKLGKPLQINESLSGGPPIPLAAPVTGSIARADIATTIESGQLRIVVNVNVSYAIE